MVNDDDNTSVKVALRIRPQNAREKAQQCRICTSVTPGEPQVTIGSDKSFTFDFVFDQPTAQNTIYEAIAEKLVEGTFDGYNATVLAYGQTGSGKTYTMGTAYDAAGTLPEFDLGIIPRAAQHIFNGIMERKLRAKEQGRVEPIFDISVQFVELYNEDIIDLLSEDRNTQANIKIGENVEKGEIYLKGVHSQTVKSPLDILNVLKNGALNRTTAATNMNQQSSRSHAIFTISMKQQRMAPIDIPTSAENGVSESAPTTPTESELEVLTAKFHFVDLAGSERLKRTGATGDRAKEGISINCGLLALGNVISALGGAQGKVSHVPYRDSKLTRLLQDSLGGNSRTLMIACASPSDVDFVETLNTLNYANRAKNIKNKVVANQDKTSKIVGELRGRIAALEAELNEYKQGKRIIGEDGQETLNDQYHENIFLQSEVNRLRTRVKALQETAEVLRGRNVTLQVELSRLTSAGLIPSGGDENANPMNGDANDHDPIASTIRNYLEEIENLKTQLIEAHATSDELRKQLSKMKSQFGVGLISNSSSVFNSPVAAGGGGLVGYSSTTTVIKAAKEEIEREKKKLVEAQTKEMAGDDDSCSDRKYSELDDEATTVEDEMNEDEVLDEDETMHDEDEEDSEDEQENDTKERDRICNDLATLQEEISIKEQLVIQLEQSEARLAQVRRDYERKLAELSQRISSTESERDRILADINAKSTNSKATEEKVKVVKEEYERKINTMRKEFSKLQALEREHERMRNQQSRQQNELKKYQNEIQEMKKNKVELMKQLKEENKRVKELERTNAKRLAGMEKESRQKDNRIRMLESRDRQREEFMKRKTEEYNNKLKQQNNGRPANARLRSSNMATQNSVMRNQQNRTVTRNALNATFNVSQTPNRRGPLRDLINQSKVLTYSPVKAKKRWNAIEKGITRYIVQRQTLDTMTEEMNRQLAERESIRQEIQKLENNFYEVPLPGIEERYVIQEELKSVNEKLRYVEDQIERVQKEFVTVEESGMKDTNEDDDIESSETPNNLEAFVEQCDNLIEAKYLLKHLLDTTLEKSIEASKAASELKQWKAKAEQLEQEQRINGQLMSQLIGEDKNVASDVTEVIRARKESSSSPEAKRANNAMTSSLYSQKARSRRTATTVELLFPTKGYSMENLNEIPEGQLTRSVSPIDDSTSQTSGQDSMKKSSVSADVYNDDGEDDAFQPGASEEPVPAKQKRMDTRSSFSRHSRFRNTIASITPGSKLRKYHSVAGLPAAKSFASASMGCEPSTSTSNTQAIPINSSKMRELLNRLVPKWSNENSEFSSKSGRKAEVVEVSPQESYKFGGRKYLSRTFTIYGHAKPVISIAANDELLITGSKDRTAKIWDLHTGTEKCVLKSHPNNVTAVKLVPNNPNMALTVSLFTVKVWDLRMPTCVHHLNSSGIAEEGENNDVSRQNTIPVYQQVISAVDVDPTGTWLFTTFNCDVRYWRLDHTGYMDNEAKQQPICCGKLAGSPRSEVSCMSMQQQAHGGLQIYTGHRDHSVKIYDMKPPFENSVLPTIELQPPHYDNVTCVLAYDDVLYTASKDKNIMKFWLNDYKRLNLTLNAHDNWINDMCIIKPLESGDPLLASICKGGTIRLWDIATSKQSHTMRDEIKKAHDRGISAVCTNSQILFTASTDDTVGIWKIASTW